MRGRERERERERGGGAKVERAKVVGSKKKHTAFFKCTGGWLEERQ